MSKLRQAIRETKEWLELNGGYDNDRPTDEDAFESLMQDCGKDASGACHLAGTEYCDWDCPFSG